jgi:hypothetical protein
MRRYLRQMIGCLALYLAVIAATNVVIDPYGVWGLVETQRLDPYKAELIERPAKAEEARRGRADVLLLGDSRVMIGIDPTHPALARHGRVENLAVAAGTPDEARRLLETALAVHPPKLVVWGIDPEAVRSLSRRVVSPEAEHSRLNPQLDLYSYYRRNLFGLRGAIDAWRAVSRSVLRPEHPWVRQGQKIDWNDGEPKAYRSNPLVLSRRLLNSSKIRPNLPTGIAHIEPVLVEAQRLGTRIVLFIPPTHAEFQEAGYHKPASRKFANRCLVELVALIERLNASSMESPDIELWDFSGFTPYHTEPFPAAESHQAQTWQWDVIHFRDSLGDLVLNRMLKGSAEPAELGCRLTSQSLPGHLVRWSQQQRAYRRIHADQVAEIAELEQTLR